MIISEVNIILIRPKNGLIGFVSLVIFNNIFLSGIAIHSKLDGSGYRLTYPTRKYNGQNFEIFYPINRLSNQAIEKAVFDKLEDVMKKVNANAGHNCHKFSTERI